MTPNQLRQQIDALDFAQLELVLYLDVHPTDEVARYQWTQNTAQLENLEQQYTQQTGKIWPMRQNHYGGTLAWIEEPWPWEYDY